ncbi:hypothetical protein CT171_00750 [Trueperella pyogenes]|uniref:hypothetical protein n=1 Tax=Trueperella pyogenes TaxID=1661 RepID=UPI000C1B74D6|nr:hypothetical protein [Trueperella pyogenes]PIN52194.1 hypothetical protein CT171_00750 [Trueperella pyogenes]
MALAAPAAGRASCHISHTKSMAGRRGTLDEMMREIVPGAVERYAKKNPNIVVAEEANNESYVNDGEGGFRLCNDISEVMEYGDSRAARLSRKITKDKKNKRGEMRGGTVTTTTFLVHLPRTMCDEVPDFYPAIDPRTGKRRIDPETGEPASRSRWVARDRDEAEEYFSAVLEYLGASVVPGGIDGILGASIQYSENTPHMHVIADTFGDDPKRPGMLRQDWSRAYSQSRDVRNEDGRIVQGWEKIKALHVGLRKQLIDRGFEVERESSERSLENLAKAEYVASMQALETAEETLAKVAKLEPEARAEAARLVSAAKKQSASIITDAQIEAGVIKTDAELDARDLLDSARAHARSAREEGREEGRVEGRAEAEQDRQRAREALDRAKAVSQAADEQYAAAINAPSIPDEQARHLASMGARHLATVLSKHVDDATRKKVEKAQAAAERTFARNPEAFIKQAREVERVHSERLARNRRITQQVSADNTLNHDGPEF